MSYGPSKRILRLKNRINEILSNQTGQPINKVARDTDRDNFMDAQEAMAYGLVDKVITNAP